MGLVDQARASAQESLAYAQAAANEFFTITALGSLGRVELALGNHQAAGGYLGELPRTAPSRRDRRPDDPAVGRHHRNSGCSRRTRPGPRLPRAVRGQRPTSRKPVGRGRGGALPRLVCRRRGRPCRRRRRRRARPRRAGRVAPIRSNAGEHYSCWGQCSDRPNTRSERGPRSNRPSPSSKSSAPACGPQRPVANWRGSAAGVPPDVQLTETERQVATLAGDGRSNKQIAAALYMGVSTVEAHLSRVYRKLGVRRAGLAARLTEPLDSAVNPVDTATQT